jgi:TRAP-type C4-dicarboxylate transport system permease small subunit
MAGSVNPTARNVAILLVIAAAVVILPGGGRVASLVAAILSIAFAGLIAYFAGRTYLERRIEIYSLDERHRALLYAALGVLLVTLAAASRLLATGIGLLAFFVLLGACGYSLFFVYRSWRQY